MSSMSPTVPTDIEYKKSLAGHTDRTTGVSPRDRSLVGITGQNRQASITPIHTQLIPTPKPAGNV